MIIIRKDTVWGPGLKVLNDDVQIAPGVKLTIQPGAQIISNEHSITAFGSFVANGTQNEKIYIEKTFIVSKTKNDIAGSIKINNTQLNGGYVAGDGNIALTNSVVSVSSVGFSFPPGKNIISGNIFLHGDIGFSIDAREKYSSIEVNHNMFASLTSLNAWATYGDSIIISHHNAFEPSHRPSIALLYNGELKSRSDYFGTSDIKEVYKSIKDGNVDLSLKNVDLAGISTKIPDGVPTSIFSFISLEMPKSVVIDAILVGNRNADILGNDLSNKLLGNSGNNILDGGLGADTMSGGAGNDTYIIDNARDVVVEGRNSGIDGVVASVTYTLADNVENLTLSGTKAINGTGNGLANHLVGNGAANVLDGKGGVDVMEGGAGNDTYFVDHASDRVSEAAGEGRDTVVTTVSYRLAAGEEIETLRTADANGKAALTLTGNAITNKLIGNAGDNVLDGGAGIDEMQGGAGNDTYLVDHARDIVVEAVRGGTDTVMSAVSYALKAGQEVETLRLSVKAGSANLTGNEFGQSLVGNAGANVLDGGLGADVLTGGRSADTFVFATTLGAGNLDHITDFAPVDDTIRLSKSLFTALAPGELKAGEFKDLAKAKIDADDHILYDSRNGNLFYDADGSGKAVAVKFAVLDNKAALTHADFLIA